MQLPDRDPHNRCGLLSSGEQASGNELELVVLRSSQWNQLVAESNLTFVRKLKQGLIHILEPRGIIRLVKILFGLSGIGEVC